MILNTAFFEAGYYTLKEAEKLTGVPASAVRRWIRGYDYEKRGDKKKAEPVWKADVIYNSKVMNITFADLIEIHLVKAFLKHNVPWRELRRAANFAAKEFKHRRPFSSFRFKTDGKVMLAEYAESSGLPRLLEITKNNFAMRDVLEPFIKQELIFDGEQVSRWYPRSAPQRTVVLDPKRSFGRPILDDFGVPTDALAASYEVERSYKKVANWFMVPVETVKAAVKFEGAVAT